MDFVVIWVLDSTWIEVLETAFCTSRGHAVAQLIEELCYKPEGRGFDSPMLSLEFFIVTILLAALCPWGSTRPPTEMSKR